MGLTKPRAAQIFNLDYKQSTRVVTTTNITLSGGAPNSVDGVNLVLGDRVLVTGQTTGSQNGLYYVTSLGTGSNGTWARTSDGNENGEIEAGMIVMVTEGTIYADTQWKLITDDPITINTTALTFTQNYMANSISSGTSNVVVNSNANVTISSAGTANVLTVSSTGTVTTGTASVTGNVTSGNVLTSGLISAAGNVTGNYFLGNVFYANGITASKIYNGTSEVNVVSSGGNVNVSIGGTSNVVVFSSAGEYVSGVISATGNIQGGNVLTAGLISATSTITSSANITGGNILTGGLISSTGNATSGNVLTTGLISSTGNAIGGNVLTTGLISATSTITSSANITGGNILTTGLISATSTITSSANITGGNILTGGLISATGNINTVGALNINSTTGNYNVLNISGTALAPYGTPQTWQFFTNNIALGGSPSFIKFPDNSTQTTAYPGTSSALSLAGNITGGNLLITDQISASGNITGNYFLGNVFYANGITASKIYSGTSEVNVVSSGGNVNVSIGGTSNVVVFSTAGEYVTGLISASGNIQGGNLSTAGQISATGNVLTSGLISSTGNVTAGNILTSGLISATGNITGGNVNTSVVRSNSGITVSTGSGNINLSPTTGNIVVNSTYINGVSDPVQNQDVATKAYVDNFATTGIAFHSPVSAATTTTLATTTGGTITYNQPNGAGNGIGATLTTTGSFNLIDTANVQTIGTRILVKNEANAVFNGVYTWSNATVITRSTDADEYGADSANALSINDYFFVNSGNVNAGSAYVVNAPAGTITFGTSNITFAQFSSSQTYTANTSAGISLAGTVINAKVDNITTAFDGGGNISVKASANLTTPNIGVATGTSLSVTGNIDVANFRTAGLITATGNVTGGNILTSGVVSATSNITGGNVLTSGLISATSTITSSANITGGNVLTSGVVSATSNITGGNVLTTGLISATSTITSSANITGGNLITSGLVTATGNVVAGNVLTSGIVSATSNITGGNITTAGLISSTGNATAGNILTAGLISATANITGGNITTAGNVTGKYFLGNANIQFTSSTAPPASGNLIGAQWYNTSTDTLYEYQSDGTTLYWIDISSAAFGSNGAAIGAYLQNGTSNVTVASNANVTTGINGATIETVASTGVYVTGVVSSTGNVIGGNLTTTGLISSTGNVTGGNLISTGAVYSNYNTTTANTASFMATGGNTKGGTGYLDFLVAQNTSGGATNPYKWLRINSTGGLEMVNSAYTSTIFSVSDSGNVNVSGQIQVSGNQAVNGPAFSAYAAAVLQTIPNNAQTKVLFQTEEFDTNSNYASSRFTPTVAGYYQLNAEVRLDGASGTGEMMIILYKNGSEYKRGTNQQGTQIAANFWAMQVSSVAYANGTTDYFEIYVQQGSGGTISVTAVNNSAITWFNGCMLRGA
jgi:filamentous hemagglutinin